MQLLRYGANVEFAKASVSTLEILDRSVFARFISALLSERGEDAIEPYELWNDSGKRMPPRKALLVVDGLPTLPYDNRTLLSKLYGFVCSQLENDGVSDAVDELAEKLTELVLDSTNGMWGQYDFGIDWSQTTFMKAFSLMPACSEDNSLLENCIAFLGFCVDIKLNMPLVLVNAKSFFTSEELDQLMEQAVFLGVQVLLVESWHDEVTHLHEEKTVLDQQFIVV